MNPKENFQEQEVGVVKEKKGILTTVTPFSKYLSLILFICLPFIGGWIGYSYSPAKILEIETVVEVEKVLVKEAEADIKSEYFLNNIQSETLREPGFILTCKSTVECDNPENLKSPERFELIKENHQAIDEWSTYTSNNRDFSFQYPSYMEVEETEGVSAFSFVFNNDRISYTNKNRISDVVVTSSTTRDGVFKVSSYLSQEPFEDFINSIVLNKVYFAGHGEASSEIIATSTFRGYPSYIARHCDMGGCVMSLATYVGTKIYYLSYEDNWSDDVYYVDGVSGRWQEYNQSIRSDILSTFRINVTDER